MKTVLGINKFCFLFLIIVCSVLDISGSMSASMEDSAGRFGFFGPTAESKLAAAKTCLLSIVDQLRKRYCILTPYETWLPICYMQVNIL